MFYGATSCFMDQIHVLWTKFMFYGPTLWTNFMLYGPPLCFKDQLYVLLITFMFYGPTLWFYQLFNTHCVMAILAVGKQVGHLAVTAVFMILKYKN